MNKRVKFVWITALVTSLVLSTPIIYPSSLPSKKSVIASNIKKITNPLQSVTADGSFSVSEVFGESSGATGTLYYTKDSSNNITFVSGDGAGSYTSLTGNNLTFPSIIPNTSYTVVGMEESAFDHDYGTKSITGKLTFPSTITSIGSFAFNNNSGISEVDFSQCNHLVSIGSLAFSYCSITNVNFTGCSGLETINYHAFYCCPISTISYPDDWNRQYSGTPNQYFVADAYKDLMDNVIGVMVCAKSSSTNDNQNYLPIAGLVGGKITLNDNLTSIPSSTFSNCNGITSIDASYCNQLVSLGVYAFENCSNLTNINFSNNENLLSVGNYCFQQCSKLVYANFACCHVLESLGCWTFYHCDDLIEINLNQCNSLKKIDSYDFLSCESLTTINLDGCNSLVTIGEGAFYCCLSLVKFTIPHTITSIE